MKLNYVIAGWAGILTQCNSSYNLGHNILELYNVLVQVGIATSKTKVDIYHKKLGI